MADMHDTPVRSLRDIDREIARMWTLYRRWQKNGAATAKSMSPLEALKSINDLLEERHTITTKRYGELTQQDSIADASEWGAADTGEAA